MGDRPNFAAMPVGESAQQVTDRVSIGLEKTAADAARRGFGRVGVVSHGGALMALLAKYAGKVLTYDFIIKELWGPRASGDNQILRVNMANIRRKIEENPAEPRYLFTEVGVGYRMAEGD